MPSTVGHALAGLAVSRFAGGGFKGHVVCVAAATAPDLDLLAAGIGGWRIDYSRRRSHSSGAAVAVGMVVGATAWLFGGRFMPHMLRTTAAYGSHLLLDYFGKEPRYGLPLLWPASNRLFAADRHVFRTIYSSQGRFFRGLATSRNARRVAREVIIVGPAVLAADLLGRVMRTIEER